MVKWEIPKSSSAGPSESAASISNRPTPTSPCHQLFSPYPMNRCILALRVHSARQISTKCPSGPLLPAAQLIANCVPRGSACVSIRKPRTKRSTFRGAGAGRSCSGDPCSAADIISSMDASAKPRRRFPSQTSKSTRFPRASESSSSHNV